MDSVRRKIVKEYSPQMEAARKKNRKQFFKKLAFIFLAVVFMMGFFVFTKASNFFSVINSGSKNSKTALIFPTENNLSLYRDENRTNILLLGIRGADDMPNGGLLTDTIMIVSIDTAKKKAALISVPRDIYLEIPVVKKKEKINAAYLYGEEKSPNGGGLELSQRSVEYVTGLAIDHVISVDFKAFSEIINELGGVDVYLDKPFSENKQWGVDFYVASGLQHLSGDVALYYARSRYSTNDFDRARRQQQVLVAMKDKALELGFLANPFKINSVLDILKNRIKTDLTLFDIIKFSRLTQEIENNSIKHKVFSTEDGILSQTFINGAYVLLPADGSFEKIREVSKNILN